MTIPLVAGLTYGIGRALDVYFLAVKNGRKPFESELKHTFQKGKRESKQVSKTEIDTVSKEIQS